MDILCLKTAATRFAATAMMMATLGATSAPGETFTHGAAVSAFKTVGLLSRIFGEEFESFTGREKNDALKCLRNKACEDMLRAGYPDAFKDEK
jgi:hypothetical protein